MFFPQIQPNQIGRSLGPFDYALQLVEHLSRTDQSSDEMLYRLIEWRDFGGNHNK